MENLTLEHLAPYLPYGLKWSLQGIKEFVMTGITNETLFTKEGAVWRWNKHEDLPQAMSPILRRCEDLLLDEWKSLDELSSTETQTELYKIANTSDREWVLSYTSYGFVQFLLKNHFDIFGLIPKGLAIDINTLK